MKLGKKIGSTLVVAGLCLSLSAVVFGAGSNSVAAPGYGTLSGTSYIGGGSGGANTSVTTNSDNAYVIAGYQIQDKSGKVVQGYYENRSAKGGKSASIGYATAPTSSYVAYGTHGVQGGSKYKAKAVYTSTHFNR